MYNSLKTSNERIKPMNLLGILAGAVIIVGLALLLSVLYKANGNDGSSICSGDCSGCRQGCAQQNESTKNDQPQG